MTGERGRRLGAYALLGALAVCAVLWFGAGVDARRTETAERSHAHTGRLAPSPRSTAAAHDGAVLPAGTDAVAAGGAVYQAPSAKVGPGAVVVVDVTVRAAAGEGEVAVEPPAVVLVVDGVTHQPWRASHGGVRTVAGGTVGFFASFEDTGVEVGDDVAVRLTLPDGEVLEFADVMVSDARVGAGARR